MPKTKYRPGRRAFVFAELVIVLVLAGLLLILAGIFFPDARRRARLAGSMQNLQLLGKGAAAFAADKENRVYSFDWQPGAHSCNGYTFPVALNANDAAADQAVCIMRERGNRPDITAIRGWAPHVLYNHLVLADYLGDALPGDMFVSPGDAPRLSWRRAVTQDPNDPNTPFFNLVCRPGGTDNPTKRWPYSSSYEMQPSFYSPDALMSTPQGVVPTVAQDPSGHRYYLIGNSLTVLGHRRMDEVRYPSHKAMLYETNQRFFGSRELFFMYPEARVPVLTADGSAGVRSIARANLGFQPNSPSNSLPTRVNYVPETTWEAPTANGGATEFVYGVIRWTRSGLRGRDFAGTEVPWAP